VPKHERFLPRKMTRFNYWRFFAPKSQHQLNPTAQRLGEYPDVAWIDLPGHTAAHRHSQHTFLKVSADSPGRQFDALKCYIENDKEWRSDRTAQEVLKQLSPRQRGAIQQLDNATWPARSERPRDSNGHGKR
jgi:hypothetical protein